MPTRIELEDGGVQFACPDQHNVLQAMESLGRRGIPVGCRGGGCGVCKVQVLEGRFHTLTMSRACVSEAEQAQGYALACKLVPLDDLRLRVVGKMARAFTTERGTFHFYGTPSASPNQKLQRKP